MSNWSPEEAERTVSGGKWRVCLSDSRFLYREELKTTTMTTAGDLQTKIAHRVLGRQNLLGRHLLRERANSKWRDSKHPEKDDSK